LSFSPFEPSFGLKNRHIQTLYASFFRKVEVDALEVEIFELPDGDFLECAWLGKPEKGSSKPIIILFHGLAGSLNSPYINGAMRSFKEEGIASVVMQFRGCSGTPNRLPRSYHSGETGDAKAWIEHLHREFPHAELFAVGYSIGGNMLLKLLGEWGSASLIKAAISVSAPMQLEVCANQMNRGFSKFYQSVLMHDLKEALLQKYKLHNMKSLIGINERRVKHLKTFWEFDGAYTAPIHGFSSAADYYEKSSSKQYLKYIEVPTLIIHSLDDPFMTPEVLPEEEELSSSITLEITHNGGHVGFVSGSLTKPFYWLDARVTDYFKSFAGLVRR